MQHAAIPRHLQLASDLDIVVLLSPEQRAILSFELCRLSSRVPTAGIFDEYASLVDTCHVVGTAHFYKYCPPVRFPRTTRNVT